MNTTICAPATVSGGAIGIIRVSGPDAVPYVNAIFSKEIATARGYTMHYGTIASPLPTAAAAPVTPVDDVILSIFRAPHSYTGEDSVEISHHGSSYIQQQILQLLIQQGCQMACPGEYTQRAFLNGKMDLTQAEAVADLIASNNAASHRVAINQMRGGISNKLHHLRDRLLHLTSLLELELDFSDHEDIEFANRSELIDIAVAVRDEIRHLSESFTHGNAIKNGIPVAIIGAPNVGKSTLLNQLLQEDRAIVSDVQGTTRDVIEDTIYIPSPDSCHEGAMFRFIDTAGIRHTDDTVESLGIERSLMAAKRALIILLVTQPGVAYPDFTPSAHQYVIHIKNKTDDFQALNGIGLDRLKTQLLDIVNTNIYSSRPSSHSTLTTTSKDDQVVLTNLRHKQALDLAYDDILRAIDTLNMNISADLVTEDLRQCLTHLAEILGGQITPDEVLGNIFKNFCIGK